MSSPVFEAKQASGLISEDGKAYSFRLGERARWHDGTPVTSVAPWLGVFPGLAIALVVFSWNLLGDALRDVLDPRLRGTG